MSWGRCAPTILDPRTVRYDTRLSTSLADHTDDHQHMMLHNGCQHLTCTYIQSGHFLHHKGAVVFRSGVWSAASRVEVEHLLDLFVDHGPEDLAAGPKYTLSDPRSTSNEFVKLVRRCTYDI